MRLKFTSARQSDRGMLKRVHVQGYKSLVDVEVHLEPLTVLFGPNTAGKSNFLNALQLLSRFGTSRTLRDAFDSPNRGKPLESFSIGEKGIEGLLEQEGLTFSIEADLRLQETVAHVVNQQIRKMRPAGSRAASPDSPARRDGVRTHDMQYRIVIEMLRSQELCGSRRSTWPPSPPRAIRPSDGGLSSSVGATRSTCGAKTGDTPRNTIASWQHLVDAAPSAPPPPSRRGVDRHGGVSWRGATPAGRPMSACSRPSPATIIGSPDDFQKGTL